MSKGSKSRIGNQAKFNTGFDKIFNKARDSEDLNIEWTCYTQAINETRLFYGLDSQIFSVADKEIFAKAFNKKYNT
tara:strand:+ start:1161 stop:1388 length:228 start_codon:yes stop_codon:yes gene_type:complete